jgi:hypothetical protein
MRWIRSMVSWAITKLSMPNGDLFKPGYAASVSIIYAEVDHAIVLKFKGLELLASGWGWKTSQTEVGPPSWVSDPRLSGAV